MERYEWMVLGVCAIVALCTVRLVETTGEPLANQYQHITPASTIDMTNGDEPLHP